MAPFDDMETHVYSAEKCLDSTEKHKDNLRRVLTEAFENNKKKFQGKPKKKLWNLRSTLKWLENGPT